MIKWLQAIGIVGGLTLLVSGIAWASIYCPAIFIAIIFFFAVWVARMMLDD